MLARLESPDNKRVGIIPRSVRNEKKSRRTKRMWWEREEGNNKDSTKLASEDLDSLIACLIGFLSTIDAIAMYTSISPRLVKPIWAFLYTHTHTHTHIYIYIYIYIYAVGTRAVIYRLKLQWPHRPFCFLCLVLRSSF